MQALHDHMLKTLQAWAVVTRDRWASDAGYGSSFEEVWSNRKRCI